MGAPLASRRAVGSLRQRVSFDRRGDSRSRSGHLIGGRRSERDRQRTGIVASGAAHVTGLGGVVVVHEHGRQGRHEPSAGADEELAPGAMPVPLPELSDKVWAYGY